MAGKVFISYRRDDSAGHAGRVHDRLEYEFGRDLLFMDVDAVPLGMNFVKILREEVAKCDVLLAVIGPNWAGQRDRQGKRRLDDPHDYVRIEIAAALQRDIPVIPVLLDGARVPAVDELPEDIEELAVRNGLDVRHASFHQDMDKLIAGLRTPLGQADTPPVPARLSTPGRTRSKTGESAIAVQAAAGAAVRTSASWLRPAAIGFGGAVVLAGAIATVVVLKGAPPAPPSQPATVQTPPAAQQSAVASTPSQQSTGLPAAPSQQSPQQPQRDTPPSQAVQPPAAPGEAPRQAPPQPTDAAQPAPRPLQPAPAPAQPATAAQPSFTALPESRERALRPGESFKECDNCPEMVVVPAGTFTMGSPDSEQGRSSDEGPQHTVAIARPFAAGKFEITVDQFAAFVKETAYDAGSKCLTLEDGRSSVRDGRSWRSPGYAQTNSHPVACINWNDAKAYLGWLAKKTGKDYRLLSEAEWEFSARAVTTPSPGSRYAFGDDEHAMCRYGNVADRTARQTIPGAAAWTAFACNDGYAYAAPVGSFAANGFGLHDIHGNVWEWTEDCYNNSYSGAPTDGSAWSAGDCGRRMMRGGMWGSSPANVRLARRFHDSADTRSQDVGFRVARGLMQ